MKNLIILFIMSLLCGCKVIDDPVDTGICESDKTKTMWEYFVNGQNGDWGLVTEAIEYAGVKNMFDGSDPDYKEITFFGPTALSIRKCLYENGLKTIYDLTPEEVKSMLISHLVSGKIMKNDCDFEVKGTNEGGKIVTSLTGKKLRVFRIKTPGQYGPETGPVLMGLHALESGFKANIASSDIELKNGVIHSLTYDYTWTEL